MRRPDRARARRALRGDRDPAALYRAPHALSSPDGSDRSPRRRASARTVSRRIREREDAAADDRSRPRAQGGGWRERNRDGLRRHGAAPQAPGGRAGHSGDRSDASRRDDGDRRRAAFALNLMVRSAAQPHVSNHGPNEAAALRPSFETLAWLAPQDEV